MAGATLMLERLRDGDSLETLGKGEAMDTVFNYFAGLIFDNVADETREVLMKTAFLPRVSAALAEAVTGKPNAIEHVEELHRRHMFTDRIAGTEVSYQYHALFRSFLRNRAVVVYTLEQRREIAKSVAAFIVADGQIDHGFALLAEAEDWDEAEKLLIKSAPNFIGQGRWQTLGLWVQSLPKHRLEVNPWVGYWLGRSKNLVSPASARPVIEAAYRIFTETGDEVGQILCATTMLEGYYFEYENFRPMDPWIERVATLLKRGTVPLAMEDELRVNSVLIMGATLRGSRLSIHESCLNRVTELLKNSFDPNTKITAACMLHEYAAVTMDFEVIQRAMEIAHPLLDSPDLSAPCAMQYFQEEAYTHYLHGRYEQGLAGFDVAAAIAKENGLQNGILDMVEFQRGLCERRAGLLDRAEQTIGRIESRSAPLNDYSRGGLSILKALVAFDRGDIARAIDTARVAYRYFDTSGELGGKVLCGVNLANMAIAGNRFAVAMDYLGQLRRVESGSVAENYLGVIALNEAWLAHRMGDTASRDKLLGEFLLRARDERAAVRLRWYTNALPELLPIAMASGIESDTARAISRELAVVPEPRDVEDWPWPVKVYTLGRFELLVEGQSPDYSRKVPKKVLSLLKVIIALGAIDVSEQKICDALWPDQEGDAANRSLTATLHRLRKLVGNAAAILQAGGNIYLDRKCCWVDTLAFEERLDRAAGNDERTEHAVALYRGAFLGQEDNAPWAAPARERLRAKFIQSIGRLGKSLEESNRHESAIELYLRGIEADSLVEPFYQGLMRCYDKLNRRAEAVSAFRRLRETLSITLGVPPSSASQRLFEALRLN